MYRFTGIGADDSLVNALQPDDGIVDVVDTLPADDLPVEPETAGLMGLVIVGGLSYAAYHFLFKKR